MCGIAGIYAYYRAAGLIDRVEFVRMREHMSARDPDSKGEWCSGVILWKSMRLNFLKKRGFFESWTYIIADIGHPGQPARLDYEYERDGTANLFMMFAPLEGWRQVKVTNRRTAVDYAHALNDLSDCHFPNAKKIVLMQVNPRHPQTGVAIRGILRR